MSQQSIVQKSGLSWKTIPINLIGRNWSLTYSPASPLALLLKPSRHGNGQGKEAVIFVKDHEEWQNLRLDQRLEKKKEITVTLNKDDWNSLSSIGEYDTIRKSLQESFQLKCVEKFVDTLGDDASSSLDPEVIRFVDNLPGKKFLEEVEDVYEWVETLEKLGQ